MTVNVKSGSLRATLYLVSRFRRETPRPPWSRGARKTLAAGIIALVYAQSALSATFVVNDVNDASDSNPGDGICESILLGGSCTLRSAVQEANALAGSDTIQIPSVSITLALAGTDDTALLGDLDLTDDINIVGTGVTLLDRGVAERFFDVVSGTATISAVRFANHGIEVREGASSVLRDSEFRDFTGEGIINRGRLTLFGVDFENVTVAIQNSGTFFGRSVQILGVQPCCVSGHSGEWPLQQQRP